MAIITLAEIDVDLDFGTSNQRIRRIEANIKRRIAPHVENAHENPIEKCQAKC